MIENPNNKEKQNSEFDNLLKIYNLGNYEEVEKIANQLIINDPKNNNILNLLSVSLAKQNRYKEAIEIIKKSILINPREPSTYINYGNIAFESGYISEAIKILNKAKYFNKDIAIIYNNLASYYCRRGDFEEAKENHRIAIEKAKDNFNKIEFINNMCSTLIKSASYEDLAYYFNLLHEKSIKYDNSIPKENINLKSLLDELDETLILVTNSGRTGSIFLQSLLDGHKEVMTTPGPYFKGFFDYPVWKALYTKNSENDWKKNLILNFVDMYGAIFNTKTKKSVPGNPMSGESLGYSSGLTTLGNDKNQHLVIDRAKFCNILYNYLENFDDMDPATFFKLIHISYNDTIGRKIDPKLLFYHIHNPNYSEITQFLALFPKTKILVSAREPIQSLESWMTLTRTVDDENDIDKIQEIISSEKYCHLKNNIFVHEDYPSRLASILSCVNNPIWKKYETRIIFLESIKKNPKSTLKDLCKWLKIEIEESTLESTFNGLKYNGISNWSKSITGFDKSSINRKIGIIFNDDEINILEKLFSNFHSKYNYKGNDIPKIDINNLDKKMMSKFIFQNKLQENKSNSVKKEILNSSSKQFMNLIKNYINYVNRNSKSINFPKSIRNIDNV